MYVCMHVCMYVCRYVWMYVCRYVCMYVCRYVWMYVCMYIMCIKSHHPNSRDNGGNCLIFDPRNCLAHSTVGIDSCQCCKMGVLYDPSTIEELSACSSNSETKKNRNPVASESHWYIRYHKRMALS